MSATIATAPKVQKFALADLEPAPYNPRQITNEAMQGLRESLTGLGLLEMPIVNVHGGKKRLVGGHQRVKALLADGKTHADCVVVEFDDVTEMAANLSMNNPAIRGDFDVRAAVPTLEGLMKGLPSPGYMGFGPLSEDLHALAERLGPLVPPSTAGDEQPEPESKVDSKPGTVYALGRHRLLCGDVANGKTLDKLFGKKKADACVTDPPYGVAYEQDSTGETLENDNLEGAAWEKFLDQACAAIVGRTKGPCFVFMASRAIPELDAAWTKAGGVRHRWLFWAKDRFTLGRGDYHHMHEPCLFGARDSVSLAPHETPRTNVLEFPKPQINDLHPTQKPVELIREIVTASTEKGAIVFDPFCGSGTTLAVCEEQGRTCYAVEIDPKHCDTIRRRWAEQVHGPECDWRVLAPALKKG